MAGYDVFICYRRKDYEFADKVLKALEKRGYHAFLDKKLEKSHFKAEIKRNICSSNDFVVILNDESLRRAVDADIEEEDWLKIEAAEALEAEINIVPLAPVGFAFPKDLPEKIAKLKDNSYVAYHKELFLRDEYFDAFIDNLVERLHSKPQLPVQPPVPSVPSEQPGLNGKEGKKKWKDRINVRLLVEFSVAFSILIVLGAIFLPRWIGPPGPMPPDTDPSTYPATTKQPGTLPPAYTEYIYRDNQSPDNRYPDIAYMGSVRNGDDGSVAVNPGSTTNPKSGGTCIAVRYVPSDPTHWAGAMWLSGNQNFPPNPPLNGIDTARAQKLSFWARGTGRVKFFIENDRNNQASLYIDMTDDWKEYNIELPKDWDTVCVGFGWAANADDARGAPITFWLDDIRYEG